MDKDFRDFLDAPDGIKPRRSRRNYNAFGWTVALLLLSGVVMASWMGSYYVFSHPENAECYELLKKVNKVEPLKRFEITAAPQGKFQTAKELYNDYITLRPAELAMKNDALLRDYLRNYPDPRTLVTYLCGDFNTTGIRDLGKTDLFPTGVAALAQSADFPSVKIEHIYPTTFPNVPRVRQMLATDPVIRLEKTFTLSAVIHVEKTDDDKLVLTVVPITYGKYAFKQGISSTFRLDPPSTLNLFAGMPVIKPAAVDDATNAFAMYRKNKGLLAKENIVTVAQQIAAPKSPAYTAPNLPAEAYQPYKQPDPPEEQPMPVAESTQPQPVESSPTVAITAPTKPAKEESVEVVPVPAKPVVRNHETPPKDQPIEEPAVAQSAPEPEPAAPAPAPAAPVAPAPVAPMQPAPAPRVAVVAKKQIQPAPQPIAAPLIANTKPAPVSTAPEPAPSTIPVNQPAPPPVTATAKAPKPVAKTTTPTPAPLSGAQVAAMLHAASSKSKASATPSLVAATKPAPVITQAPRIQPATIPPTRPAVQPTAQPAYAAPSHEIAASGVKLEPFMPATQQPAPLVPSVPSVPAISQPQTAPATASWHTYQPGAMPRGRLVTWQNAPAYADLGIGNERMYMEGRFVVTASTEGRAVLRPVAYDTDSSSNVRIVVEYPAGTRAPAEGTQVARGNLRPFQVMDVRRGGDGQVNVYTREITEPLNSASNDSVRNYRYRMVERENPMD